MILLLFFQVEKKKLTSECQGAIVSKTPAVATCDLRKSFRYVTWHLGLFPIAPEEKKNKNKNKRGESFEPRAFVDESSLIFL